ncbi:DUF692 domain-containing protein [Rhodococcus sp. NPDC055112]
MRTRVHGMWRYDMPSERLAEIDGLAPSVLLHGVGQPFAGSTLDPVDYFPLLRDAVDLLDPVWISEHLSFMRVRTASGVHETGFLLPPLQSEETVRVATARIGEYRRRLGRPVAFETGVNYLRYRYGPLDDGTFFRRVSENADAGILLDLHNLWCNHVNGRAELQKVLDRIPLDRVWEVHLAGGSTMDGVWLDAHSGPIPEALIECTAEIMPRLSALRALIYEVMPQQADRMGVDQVREQLDTLRALWRLVPSGHFAVSPGDLRAPQSHILSSSDIATVESWEQTLHTAVGLGPKARRGQTSENSTYSALAGDPGLDIYRKLVNDARLGCIAQTLRYTVMLLLMHLGSRLTRELLEQYSTVAPAQSYAAIEGHQFCTYLRSAIESTSNGLAEIPYLSEVLAFESALLKSAVFGESSTVSWTVNPSLLLSTLDAGLKPDNLPSAPQTSIFHAGTDRHTG